MAYITRRMAHTQSARLGDKIAGFLITLAADGSYGLQDTDGFNNWGRQAAFSSIEAAAAYAIACDEFKCGRRMSLPGKES